MNSWMGRLIDSFYLIAVTAWVGMLWTVGYLVAPTLFYSLESRQLAGNIAGQMFLVSGWLGLGLAFCLALLLLVRGRLGALRTLEFWLVLLMGLLTAASLFGIQPLMAQMKLDALPRDVMESLMRDRFVAWHGISSGLYLLQSLLALGLVLKIGRSPR